MGKIDHQELSQSLSQEIAAATENITGLQGDVAEINQKVGDAYQLTNGAYLKDTSTGVNIDELYDTGFYAGGAETLGTLPPLGDVSPFQLSVYQIDKPEFTSIQTALIVQNEMVGNTPLLKPRMYIREANYTKEWTEWKEFGNIDEKVYYIEAQRDANGLDYNATIEGLTEYKQGMVVIMKPSASNAANGRITLNINELGKCNISKNSGSMKEGELSWLGIYTLVYNGGQFILQGYPNLSDIKVPNINNEVSNVKSIYVDGSKGIDAPDAGSASLPYQTIQFAINRLDKFNLQDIIIYMCKQVQFIAKMLKLKNSKVGKFT